MNPRTVAALAIFIAASTTLAVLLILPGYASLTGSTYNEDNSADVKYITISLGENQYSGAVTSSIKYHTITGIDDNGRAVQYVPDYVQHLDYTVTALKVEDVHETDDHIVFIAYGGNATVVTIPEAVSVQIGNTVTAGGNDYEVTAINTSVMETNEHVKFIATGNNAIVFYIPDGMTVRLDDILSMDVAEVVTFNISLDSSDVIPTFDLHITVDDASKMTGTFFVKYNNTNYEFPPSDGITISTLSVDSIELKMYVHAADLSINEEPVVPLNNVSFVFRAEVASS